MEIPEEQINQLKQQIIQQITSSFPKERQQDAIDQINSMNNEQFIAFLKQNKLIKDQKEGSGSESSPSESLENPENESKTPFRLIVEDKLPHYKIDENKEALAVLEINPVSKAHLIIIPKTPAKESDKIPQQAFSLAKKLSKKIKIKYKPKEILISSSIVLGEVIINVLPVYSNETLNSERKPSSKEELEELRKNLEVKKRAKSPRKPRMKKLESKKLWLPKRIP